MKECSERVRTNLDSAASNGELTVYDYRDNPSSPTVTKTSGR